MKKFFITLMCIVMVVCFMPTVAMADDSGSINGAVITQNAVSVELQNVNFESSVQVQLYSGDTPLTTATLNTDKLGAGSYPYLTCCIATETADDYWPLTDWTPRADLVPNKAVLIVDGSKVAEKEFNLNAGEWKQLSGVKSSEGSIMRAYLNTDRITVDMNNVTFFESVALELYSGDTLLTTSTLNTESLKAGTYGELTGMISLIAADECWSYKPWTPEKNVVPNKVKLIVDGVLKDTEKLVVVFNGEETRDITDDDWKALEATVYTASGSIESAVITHDNETLKNAVSVELENVAFNKSVEVKLYSGDALLTTATLNTDKLGAGSYPYLTCCIATETADKCWSLTPWTPKDEVVPNKAVLIVDGHELYTKAFTLDKTEWANLPGTEAPQNSSGWYYTDPLRPARTEAANAVANYVNPADYEEAQQAEIKTIVDNAKKNIEAAKTADEIKAIEASAKAELDKLETAEEMSLIRAIGETKFVARSKAVTLKNGKKAIKITWYDKNRKEVKFDGVEIFRSTKRYSGYGKEPIYVSKSGVYYNTAIEAGTKYYYKVRGYVLVNGEKVYTDYSTKAWRTA